MKLGKASLVLLGIGVLTVLCAGFAMAYSSQNREQSQFNHQLMLVQPALRMPPSQATWQVKQMEQQAAQAESEAEAAKLVLSQPVDSIVISNTLFDMARRRGVEVVEIGFSGVTSTKLEGFEFNVLPLRMKVAGNVAALVDFVLALGETFPTSVLKSLEVTVPPENVVESGVDGEEREKQERPSVKLEVHIYQYKGNKTWPAK